jgi:hypothetical protein
MTPSGISAIITHLPGHVTSSFSQLSSSSFDKEDSIDYFIQFRPPLTPDQAKAVRITAEHGKKIIFTQLLMDGKHVHLTLLGDGELEYELFETHQLKVTSDGHVQAMYFTIENNRVFANQDWCLERHIDMKLFYMSEHFEYANLQWFPPDVDLQTQYGIKVNASKIPQRCPMWFKLRGHVTGTKAYALLGFFVPLNGTYDYNKGQQDFSPIQRANMRNGALSEDMAILNYLTHYKNRKFEEVGWVELHGKNGWGASPDGVIHDLAFDDSELPEETKAAYSDFTRGAIEIKTSRNKSSMEAYFIPQVYMEMMSLGVAWCDLIRYCNDECYVYRIYRDPKVEQFLLALWNYAYERRDKLQQVIQEERFVSARKFFEDMAGKMYPIVVIPPQREAMDEYKAYKDQLLHVQVVVEDDSSNSNFQQADDADADPCVSRAVKIRKCQNRLEVTKLIAEQLRDYSELLRKNLVV